MARKTHTKSRMGCIECKRRHLKCDEGRPICRKCTFSHRECFYPSSSKEQPDQSTDIASSEAATILSARSPDCPSANAVINLDRHSVLLNPASVINIHHVELFYHFTTDTCQTIAISSSHVDIYKRMVTERAFQQPCLLAEIIAFSACHMSLKRPDNAAIYHEIASSQQTCALAEFNGILNSVDETTCLDVLLFSHLIALHVFWDIFASIDDDFSVFLDRLLGCIRMLRGINVVIRTWWNFLVQTELGAIILNADQQQNTPKPSSQECDHLRAMVDDADISVTSMGVYCEALDSLQTYFDSENVFATPANSTHQVFAWLVVASEGYTDLLDQRRPEALVILAYYALLLHRRDQSWVIGDAGKRLLMHIRSYLGRRWDRWLEYPTRLMGE